MFLPMIVVTFIVRTVSPTLDSESMLNIFEPLPCIAGAVLMEIYTFAVSFVIKPFSLIHIPISMYQPSAIVGLVIFPIALIYGIVFPYLSAATLSHPIHKLSNITSSSLELNGSLDRLTVVILFRKLERAKLQGNRFDDVVVEIRLEHVHTLSGLH